MVGICGEPGLKNSEVGFRELIYFFPKKKKKKNPDLIVEIMPFVINILN